MKNLFFLVVKKKKIENIKQNKSYCIYHIPMRYPVYIGM